MKTAAQKTHDRLLNCAASLFDENGYTEVTVDDICQAAKVSRATFYNHFSGKEDLAHAFYTQEQVYSPSNVAWVISAATPLERLIRAHMCYFRHPTVSCAFDVYIARCQYLITHISASSLTNEGYSIGIFLPLVQQAREAGEIQATGELTALVQTFSFFQFGYDISWVLNGRISPYAPGLARGLRHIYGVPDHIPVETYIENCLKP